MRNKESPIHDVLSSGLEFVQTCTFEGLLFDLGRYPALKPGNNTVHGELYRITDTDVLVKIDAYEAVDNDDASLPGFSRKRVVLKKPSIGAWIYYYDGDIDDERQITSGKW